MPLFPDIDALEAYVDFYIKANGNNEITGPQANTSLNGCIEFIRQSPLNWAKSQVSSTNGAAIAVAPVVAFSQTPSSLYFGDNIYNEFVFINMTGTDIDLLSPLIYYDLTGSAKTTIPANSVLNIFKAANDLWVQGNNIGGGSGTPLPPQVGHQGEILITNGANAQWNNVHIPLQSADFEPNGKTYINTYLTNFKYDVFVNEISRYLYDAADNAFEGIEWEYYPGGGFVILTPAIDTNLYNYHFKLALRGLNT